MNTIESFNFGRLSNTEFTAFCVNIQKVIGEINIQNLGITIDQKAVFDEQLKILIDRVYYSRASEYTAQMNESDSRRIDVYRRILAKLGCVQYCEDDRDLKQLKDLVTVNFLSKYKLSVVNIAQQERTAIISGFIYDLNDKLDEDAQETLGIYSDIISLVGANNGFIAAYNSRNTQRVEVEKGLTANCRKQLTDFFVLSSFLIQHYANQPAEGEAAAKVKDCIDYIQRVNGLLADARVRLNQRLKKEGEIIEDGEGSNGSSTGDTSGSNGSTNTNNSGNGGQTIDPGSGAVIDGDMAIL